VAGRLGICSVPPSGISFLIDNLALYESVRDPVLNAA
jgi:hypothetical protein